MKKSSDNKSSGAGLRSSKSLVAISTFAWCLIWLATSGMPIFAMLAIPALILSLLLSIPLIGSKKWHFLPIVTSSAFISLVLLLVVASGISYVRTNTSTYYLGLNISTPNGIVSKKSMVQTASLKLPIVLKHFNLYEPKAIGEAVFCQLDNGRTVIASLWLRSISSYNDLQKLPWLAAGHSKNDEMNWPESIKGRFELKGDLQPITVAFSDITTPQSIAKILPDGYPDALGPGYSIKSIWVETTNDPYRSFGIRDHIPWIWPKEVSGMTSPARQALRKVGFSRLYNPLFLTND